MPPASTNKVTKFKASARKPKTTVPLDKYETDLFIMWRCWEDQKTEGKADYAAIANVVGLSKEATSKRASRIGIAMRDWKDKRKPKESEEQPEAQEEVEVEGIQEEVEDSQAEAQLEEELKKEDDE